MAKRSPILGYNHNVRYRGLVWHVQTEDSGLANPHLFTHLFHEGVIVSTRKLVYDNGADEGAIKSLMQAQHKAVMKDLKRGHFDDKIDMYLGGTPGLLPRGGVEEAAGAGDGADKADAPAAAAAAPKSADRKPMVDAPTSAGSDLDPPTVRVELPTAPNPIATRPGIAPVPAVTTASGVATPRAATPPGMPEIPRTATKAGTEAAPARTGTTAPTPKLALDLDPPTELSPRTASADPVAQAKLTAKQLAGVDSSAEISLELGDDDDDDQGDADTGDRELPNGRPRRRTHDTEINVPQTEIEVIDDGATRKNLAPADIELGAAGASLRDRPVESVSPLPPPATEPPKRTTGNHPAMNASALPPPRQIARPPTARPVASAIPTPTVVARPLAANDPARARTGPEQSEAIEIYAPAPPSVDAPPGAQPERPGQYAQHRGKGAIPADAIGRGAAPRGPLPNPQTQPLSGAVARTPTPGASSGVPQPVRADHPSGSTRARTPTPARIPQGPTRPNTAASGGVVMTRPAVIVGAPAKPPGGTAPARPRKAREEEAGRGFGQGLISEKSLDEVILAYLSEDADDK